MFLDGYYQRYAASGRLTGGYTGRADVTIKTTSNDIGANVGVGAKVKLVRSFYLSPEVYYDAFLTYSKDLYMDNITGRKDAYISPRQTGHSPAVRLLATVAF
jgi:hypothetical protein